MRIKLLNAKLSNAIILIKILMLLFLYLLRKFMKVKMTILLHIFIRNAINTKCEICILHHIFVIMILLRNLVKIFITLTMKVPK